LEKKQDRHSFQMVYMSPVGINYLETYNDAVEMNSLFADAQKDYQRQKYGAR